MDESLSPNTEPFYYYTSAPTSPRSRRYDLNGLSFLSMPTSPTRQLSRGLSGLRSPETIDELAPFPDNFEFEGSKRFYLYDNGSEKSQDLAMAYADELFYDGKMLPLRPPPRAYYIRTGRKHGSSSASSSPGARKSMRKVPFMKQKTLWNDEFDPFMVALSKVKEYNDVMSPKEKAHLRRTKSLSPLRCPNGSENWNIDRHKRSGLSPDVWMEVNGPRKDELNQLHTDIFRPIPKPRVDVGRPAFTESKKQRMKKFLLKNASFGKKVSGEKGELRAPLLMRKMYSSGRCSCATRAKGSNAIMRITRDLKTVMKHRAKVLFCLVKGFGIKDARKDELK